MPPKKGAEAEKDKNDKEKDQSEKDKKDKEHANKDKVEHDGATDEASAANEKNKAEQEKAAKKIAAGKQAGKGSKDAEMDDMFDNECTEAQVFGDVTDDEAPKECEANTNKKGVEANATVVQDITQAQDPVFVLALGARPDL